jgi:two-component system sensor histidine kinase SenX3
MIGTVVVGFVAAGALVAVAVYSRRERDLVRRVGRATARLGGRPVTAGTDAQLDALDEAIEVATGRAAEVVASERLVRALDTIPQGVVICDERGSVVFENEVGAVFSRARHGDALVSAAITELLTGATAGSASSRTLDLYGPPRRTLVIDVYPLPASRGNGVTGALAVIEDVSERRRLEHVRRDFVANISHELKTPVGALALLAETLLTADDPVDRERLAQRLLDEAHRVGHTIDDLLSLSRIEADQSTEWGSVRLSEVIEEAAARAASGAEQRDIRIEVAPTGGLAVRGDSRQLVSALFNLLDNAVKYSDDGSSVAVSALLEGNWVELSVADQGPGIPSRDLERIFERFYRVDRARSRDTGGTGLGLAIVRHVATNHGGVVTVESREGEGSRFTLRLPGLPTTPSDQPGIPAQGSVIERSGV